MTERDFENHENPGYYMPHLSLPKDDERKCEWDDCGRRARAWVIGWTDDGEPYIKVGCWRHVNAETRLNRQGPALCGCGWMRGGGFKTCESCRRRDTNKKRKQRAGGPGRDPVDKYIERLFEKGSPAFPPWYERACEAIKRGKPRPGSG